MSKISTFLWPNLFEICKLPSALFLTFPYINNGNFHIFNFFSSIWYETVWEEYTRGNSVFHCLNFVIFVLTISRSHKLFLCFHCYFWQVNDGWKTNHPLKLKWNMYLVVSGCYLPENSPWQYVTLLIIKEN